MAQLRLDGHAMNVSLSGRVQMSQNQNPQIHYIYIFIKMAKDEDDS